MITPRHVMWCRIYGFGFCWCVAAPSNVCDSVHLFSTCKYTLVEVPTTCTSWSWKSRKIRKSCLRFAVLVCISPHGRKQTTVDHDNVKRSARCRATIGSFSRSLSVFSFLHFFHSVHILGPPFRVPVHAVGCLHVIIFRCLTLAE